MIWKLLLTLAVLLGGWFFVRAKLRARRRAPPGAPGWTPPPRRRLPPGTVRTAAYTVLALMLLGSGGYLYRGWAQGNQVLEVQVVNAATGAVSAYQARRRDIEGRVFRTLDGREVRLADVERMVLVRERQGF